VNLPDQSFVKQPTNFPSLIRSTYPSSIYICCSGSIVCSRNSVYLHAFWSHRRNYLVIEVWCSASVALSGGSSDVQQSLHTLKGSGYLACSPPTRNLPQPELINPKAARQRLCDFTIYHLPFTVYRLPEYSSLIVFNLNPSYLFSSALLLLAIDEGSALNLRACIIIHCCLMNCPGAHLMIRTPQNIHHSAVDYRCQMTFGRTIFISSHSLVKDQGICAASFPKPTCPHSFAA
jgi:hypothetical protein